MSDLGAFAVRAGLVCALYAIAAVLISVRRRDERLLASARNGVFSAAAFVTLVSLVLLWGFVRVDFSILYVAKNTSLATPLFYRISGFWGSRALV